MKKKTQKKIFKKKVSTGSKVAESLYPIEPLSDRVLIREDNESKEKTTASGIIIPSTVVEDKSGKRGVVIAIGKGRYEDGKYIPLSVKVNDKVLFQWGDKIVVDDTEYFVVRESEILAIIR
jgi:chaperonin GroES